MDFSRAKKQLHQIFQENDFAGLLQTGQKHAKTVQVARCSNKSVIWISFPGYKAMKKAGKIIFDYRVMLEKHGGMYPLSHTNLIVDIYTKCLYGNMEVGLFEKFLAKSFEQGNDEIPVMEIRYTDTPAYLLQYIKKAHRDKKYLLEGNRAYLTLEELFLTMKWIVIQEDMNYPVKQGLEGRKMPLSRYMEAIEVARNGKHELKEVIRRALSHSRPRKWDDMDYSFLNALVIK